MRSRTGTLSFLAVMALLVAACAPAATPSPTAVPAKPGESKPAESKPAAAPTTAPVAAKPTEVAKPAAAPATSAEAAKPAAKQDLGKMRIALFDVVYNAPVYVAHELGFWKELGVESELVQTRSGQLAQVALQSGQADYAVAGVESLMNLREQGGRDVIATWNLLNRLTMNVVMDKELAAEKNITRQTPLEQRYQALKGLTIGVTAPGAVSDVYMRYYLRKAGADPDRDANLVAIGDASALLAALKTKQIQAYMLSAPTPQFAENEGFGTITIKSSEGDVPEFAEYVYVFYAAHREYVEKNPDQARAFVAGLNTARDFVVDPKNREKVDDVMKKYFGGMSDDVLKLSLDDTIPAFSKDGKFSEPVMRRTLDIVAETGQIQPEWKDRSAAEGGFWTNKYH
jgi:NitT/TauT family transport system substrate-binding protein